MEDDELGLKSEIATRLKGERLRLGLSHDDLATAVGLHRGSIYNYENGFRAPDAVALARMHTQAGFDVGYVVTGSRSSQPTDLSAGDAALLERIQGLPPKLRDVVDNVALLAFMTYSARRDYDYGESFKPTQSATVVVAHDSLGAKPARRPRKP